MLRKIGLNGVFFPYSHHQLSFKFCFQRNISIENALSWFIEHKKVTCFSILVYCADQDFEHILLLRFLRTKIGFGDILSVILRQHLKSLHVLFVLYLSLTASLQRLPLCNDHFSLSERLPLWRCLTVLMIKCGDRGIHRLKFINVGKQSSK